MWILPILPCQYFVFFSDLVFYWIFLIFFAYVSGLCRKCLRLRKLVFIYIININLFFYLMQWIGSNTPGTLCSLVVILVFIDMTLFGAYQVSLEYFNSIAAVYFCVSVMISVNGNIYHNQYAIKVTIENYIILYQWSKSSILCQVRGGNKKARTIGKELGMSLVENIFDNYFLYEVPHINKRYAKYSYINKYFLPLIWRGMEGGMWPGSYSHCYNVGSCVKL